MDFLKSLKQPTRLPSDSPEQIEDKLQRRYLDRLALRLKVLRRHLAERNWETLRAECVQLQESAANFGLPALGESAGRAVQAFPKGKLSRAGHFPAAKPALESLLLAIDEALIEHSIHRA